MRKKICLSDTLFTFGFSIVILLALSRTLALTFMSLDIVLITLALTVAFALMSRFKWLSLVIIAALVLFLIIIWRSDIAASFVNFLGTFIQWIWGLIEVGYDDPHSVYMLFTLSLICFAVSLPVFLLVRHNAHVLLFLIVGIVMFFSQQLLGFELDASLLGTFLFLIILYSARQAMPQNGRSELMLLVSVPLCLALLMVTIMLPASEESVGASVFATVGRAVSWMTEWISFKGISGPFAVSAGETILDYGDVEGDLGGEVVLGDATVMFVKGDRPVYLKSRSYSTFTGRRWETENKRTTSFYTFSAPDHDVLSSSIPNWDWEIDYERFSYENLQLPIMAYLTREDIASPRDFYDIDSMSVHYWDISTDKIYSPYWAVDFKVADEFAGEVPLYKQANSDILSDKALFKDFSYTVDVIRPKLKLEDFTELYRLSRPGYWETMRQISSGSGDTVIISMLSTYSYRAASIYTQLPDSTTERTKNLAEHITSGLDNNFDRAIAIERFLRENYLYNTSPPNLPDKADFVDHFLFEGKEGYCTYFATAMTVLCRSVDVPARYVEGYAPSDIKREDYYVVTGQQAHAWVEVYLEGAGWVPFEPTSAYASEGIRAQQAAAPSANPSSFPVPSDPMFTEPEDEILQPQDVQTTPEETSVNFPHPLLFVVGALAVLIIIQIIRRRVFLSRMKSAGFSSRDAERLFDYFVRALHVMKLPIRPSETPLEFSKRAGNRFWRYKEAMTASASAYCKVRYGVKAPSVEDHEMMLKALEDIQAQIKRELGWRIIFLRYIAGLI